MKGQSAVAGRHMSKKDRQAETSFAKKRLLWEKEFRSAASVIAGRGFDPLVRG